MNDEVYTASVRQALKVELLTTKEEFVLYANALYSAMMWGREVDGKNRAIRERDKSVK